MIHLPPYAGLLRLQFEEGEEPLIRMPFHEDVVGRPGYLHGGAIAGLLEFAAFTSLAQAIGDAGVAMKPVTVTVDYMRGGSARDTFAAAQVQRLGTRVANVEAFAWQAERSSPIAAGRINFLLERP
ncbi:MAG TPA: PaaI family thioesterase [Sphingomicrobium sp.]|nr:PaaI family thioesterase [Sphingomicrobium sp.]